MSGLLETWIIADKLYETLLLSFSICSEVAALFCREAPEMFCGLWNFTDFPSPWSRVDNDWILIFWANCSFKSMLNYLLVVPVCNGPMYAEITITGLLWYLRKHKNVMDLKSLLEFWGGGGILWADLRLHICVLWLCFWPMIQRSLMNFPVNCSNRTVSVFLLKWSLSPPCAVNHNHCCSRPPWWAEEEERSESKIFSCLSFVLRNIVHLEL